MIPIIGGLIVAAISFKVGSFSYGAGIINITSVITTSFNILNYSDVLGRYINICATALSGVAGGLLLPSLAVGGGIGSLMSELAPDADARIFVTTGMTAFLGAMMHVPLTAAVLVLEVTNQRELIMPLVISSIIGSWVFQRLNDMFIPSKPLQM